jgi:hypothetical protein
LVPEVITTHDALVDAAHVQSRVVVTVIVPAAPPAGTDDMEFAVVTSHFEADGPVTETEDDPHALRIGASASAAASAAGRAGFTAAARCNSSACMSPAATRARPFVERVILRGNLRAAEVFSCRARAAQGSAIP